MSCLTDRRVLSVVVLFIALLSRAAEAATASTVTAGWYHTCAVNSSGSVWCWGYNSSGQLGDGTLTPRMVPAAVSGLPGDVVGLAAGSSHTCAVTRSGAVWCWGDNNLGQLGDGTMTPRLTPVAVSGLGSGVVALAAGLSFTCAVTGGGAVWCWGANGSGQLGDGTTAWRLTPVPVYGLASGVVALSTGASHVCAVTSVGALLCWGANTLGELGDGTLTQRSVPGPVTGLGSGVVAVAAGWSSTCAVVSGGAAWCWGANTYGQLGDGTTVRTSLPVAVSGLGSGVKSIAAGMGHACASTESGAVFCWGDNTYGQIGDRTAMQRPTPVAVSTLGSGVAAVTSSGFHACATTGAGALRCWGFNGWGQLGDGSGSSRATPVIVNGLADGVLDAAAGGGHTCAVVSGGSVSCWGFNGDGEVGDGTTLERMNAVQVFGLESGVAAVATGAFHTCARTTNGAAWCWGRGDAGQIGDGSVTGKNTPAPVIGLGSGVVDIAAGGAHSCAVTSGGALWCWGGNWNGELGNGSTTRRVMAVAVSGLESGVMAVAAGQNHTCAIASGGALWCWGRNSEGQLGDGTTTRRLTPVAVSGLESGVVAVAAGKNHTCAVTSGGAVSCWGANIEGQLGDGTTTARSTPAEVDGLGTGFVAVTAADSHSCAKTSAGAVLCWGGNEYGQLGDSTTTRRLTPVALGVLESGVVSATAGGSHTCAVTTAGALRCWGKNSVGELGDGSTWRVAPVRTLRFGQSDFDADDRADVAVYRASSGTWFSLDSSTHNTSYRWHGWGVDAEGDVPVVGDFDGDGVLDPTVFRAGTGTWFTLKSSSGFTNWTWFGWGAPSDVVMPGDYDGDGITDAAVYRSATGEWFIRRSTGAVPWSVVFGQIGDVPVRGDFDGDGRQDPAVYRPATGTWFWLKSSSGCTEMDYRGWGVESEQDRPVPADYDGDGVTDLAVYRPGSGTWFILESHASFSTWTWFGWGSATDEPLPADYDGDGKADFAVFRPSTGEWWVVPSSGAAPWNVLFGGAGDAPLQGLR